MQVTACTKLHGADQVLGIEPKTSEMFSLDEKKNDGDHPFTKSGQFRVATKDMILV